MIHGFVRQSGGQVLLRSEAGHGTTVAIYLPRHLEEASQLAEAEILAVSGPRVTPADAVVLRGRRRTGHPHGRCRSARGYRLYGIAADDGPSG